MGIAFLTILLIAFFIAFVVMMNKFYERFNKDEKKIRELDIKIKRLFEIIENSVISKKAIKKEELAAKEITLPDEKTVKPEEAVVKKEEKEKINEETLIKEKPPVNIPSKSAVKEKQQQVKKQETIQQKPPVKKEKKKNEFLEKFGTVFIENWIGIIAAVLLVIGLCTFGIYAALKFKPLSRFFMLTGVSVLLMTAFFILYRIEIWRKLSLWLRSSSGAIYLFACVGAGGIPGLQWITPDITWINYQILALLVLLTGIIFNIILAFAGGKQVFASLHVLLSIAAIWTAPIDLIPKEYQIIILCIALFITVAGVLLTYREKWEWHLLLTTTCFFAYLVYWKFNIPYIVNLHRNVGMGAISIVSLLALLVYYRKSYIDQKFSPILLIIHLLNWSYFGIGLLMLAYGIKWVAVLIGLGAVVIFLVARYAKYLGIRWLYITDTLIGLLTALIAVVSLFQWEFPVFPISAIMFIVAVIYSVIMLIEREKRLFKIGILLQNLIGISAVIINFFTLNDTDNLILSYRHSLILIILTFIAVLFKIFVLAKNKDLLDYAKTGLSDKITIKYNAIFLVFVSLMAGFNAFMLVMINRLTWLQLIKPEYVLLISTLAFLFTRNRLESKTLYVLDIVLSQALCYASIILLFRWDATPFIIIAIIFMESIAFTSMMLIKKEEKLAQAGIILQNILSLILIVINFTTVSTTNNFTIFKNSIILLISALGSCGFYILNIKSNKNEENDLAQKRGIRFAWIYSATVCILLIAAVILMLLREQAWMQKIRLEYILLLSTLSLIFIRGSVKYKIINTIDKLIAQIAAFTAIILLYRWGNVPYVITAVILLETVIFYIMNMIKKEKILIGIGYILLNLMIVILLVIFASLFDDYMIYDIYKISVILSVFIVILVLLKIIINKFMIKIFENAESDKSVSAFLNINFNILGFLIPMIALSIYAFMFHNLPWIKFKYIGAEYLMLIPLLFLIIIRKKFQFNGLGLGLIILILVMHITQWYNLYRFDYKIYQTALYTLPLFIVSLSAVRFSFIEKLNKYIKWFGIYLFFIHLSFIIYFILKPVSTLLPSIVWLLLAPAVLEYAVILRNIFKESILEKGKSDLYLIHAAYGLIIAFLIRHILVHMQPTQPIWIFKPRLLIGLLALAVFAYILFHKKPKADPYYKIYEYINPLFLELIIVFSAFTVFLEVKQIYHPVIWIAGSIICFIIGCISKEKFKRLKFYSLLLFWATAVHIVFITSRYNTTKITKFEWEWFIAVCAIFAQFIYLVIFHVMGGLKDIETPASLKFLKSISKVINIKPNLWIYFPLFISIGLFIYFSFPRSILALLYGIEAFSIFLLSVILRENTFKYISYFGIIGSGVLLIFYNLPHKNMLNISIVCIGISLIMFGMHAIYKKYKGRFVKDENKDPVNKA